MPGAKPRGIVRRAWPLFVSVSLHATALCAGIAIVSALRDATDPGGPARAAQAEISFQSNDFAISDVADSGCGLDVFPKDSPVARAKRPQELALSDVAWTPCARPIPAALNVGPAQAGYFGVSNFSLPKVPPQTFSETGPGSGPMAMFGVPGGGPLGEARPEFFSCHLGNARSVAFVCDASGSMVTGMPTLKAELRKAVASLRPNQSFNVIFFGSDRSTTFEHSLVPATPDNKHKARVFLDDVVASGSTEPLTSIAEAFRQKPQVLYLLTDGDFPDNQAALNLIRKLNADKKVRVNTLAFGAGDLDSGFVEFLKTVGKENGGAFKQVSLEN